MENDIPLEALSDMPSEGENAWYSQEAGLRLLLLALVFLTGNFFIPQRESLVPINVVLALALLFNLAVIFLNRRYGRMPAVPAVILTGDLLFMVMLCHFTGGADSPVAYLGISYLYLIVSRMGENKVKWFLLAYASAILLLPALDRHKLTYLAFKEYLLPALMNLALICALGWPAVLLAAKIRKEHGLQKATESTFHAFHNALHLRTQNLQSALEALTEAHEQLKKLDKTKTANFSNLTHEFRTPLASIKSFAEILSTYEDLDRATQKEFLEIITKESMRLTQLINGILDLAKIESGTVTKNHVKVDMVKVITDSMKALKPLAREKGLSLEFVQPDEPLPLVKGDNLQLPLVMVNLLNNAIKFTAQGGITVTAKKDREYLQVAVKDTGEGIFPEEQKVIFEEFYRIADNIAGRPKGSGLGLTISKKIIEYHGGTIWAESELGKGSTFTFRLPIDLDEMALIPERQAAGARRARIRKNTSLILVLERDIAVRQFLRERLEALGYSTIGAEPDKSGLTIAMQEDVDLVLSGIINYQDTDVNFLKELNTKEKTSTIPILITCLLADPKQGLQLAANGFLSKPIDRFDLLKAVEEVSPSGKGPFIGICHDRLEGRTIQLLFGAENQPFLLADESAGVDACRREKPSLIFLDTTPPIYSWRHILSDLRQGTITSQIPVILITDMLITHGNIRTAALGKGTYAPERGHIEPLLMAIEQIIDPERARME
ncbi:MAG: ATP-binding protein [Nitrospirae bacterium]|nr:ATP-binding protein [Nitrospirota bacterium]